MVAKCVQHGCPILNFKQSSRLRTSLRDGSAFRSNTRLYINVTFFHLLCNTPDKEHDCWLLWEMIVHVSDSLFISRRCVTYYFCWWSMAVLEINLTNCSWLIWQLDHWQIILFKWKYDKLYQKTNEWRHLSSSTLCTKFVHSQDAFLQDLCVILKYKHYFQHDVTVKYT